MVVHSRLPTGSPARPRRPFVTHNFVTHSFVTHNFVTHNSFNLFHGIHALEALTWLLCGRHAAYCTTNLAHILSPATFSHATPSRTTLSHTQTTLSHTVFHTHATLSHTTLSHPPRTHNSSPTHTQHCHVRATLSHTRTQVVHTNSFVTRNSCTHSMVTILLHSTLSHTHNNRSHPALSRKTLLPTSLSHTAFHTHTQLFYIQVLNTHKISTHACAHKLPYTTLSDTVRHLSSTIAFLFPASPIPCSNLPCPYWRKLTCGVIRSLNLALFLTSHLEI